MALDEAIVASEQHVPVELIEHRNVTYESPARWVVCFLGSLRNLRNFDGVQTNSQVNLMIVCLTNDPIDDDMLNVLKELVSQTQEGALIILRYTLADE